MRKLGSALGSGFGAKTLNTSWKTEAQIFQPMWIHSPTKLHRVSAPSRHGTLHSSSTLKVPLGLVSSVVAAYSLKTSSEYTVFKLSAKQSLFPTTFWIFFFTPSIFHIYVIAFIFVRTFVIPLFCNTDFFSPLNKYCVLETVGRSLSLLEFRWNIIAVILNSNISFIRFKTLTSWWIRANVWLVLFLRSSFGPTGGFSEAVNLNGC